MYLTIQARIPAMYSDLLQAEAERYFYYMADMFSLIATGQGTWPKLKTEFHHRHGIPHRLVTSIHTDLAGKLEAIRELNADRLEELHGKEKSLKKSLKAKQKKIQEVKDGQLKFEELKTYLDLKKSKWHVQYKLDKTMAGIQILEEQETHRVPSICFGTKELFKKQWFLKENKLDLEEWYSKWWQARNHQLFYVGSKDETAGCSNCIATLLQSEVAVMPEEVDKKPLNLSLKLRRFREGNGKTDWLSIAKVEINQHQALIKAILIGDIEQAISYRFHRDDKGWRVFLQIEIPAATLGTLNKKYGVLGIDFNGDHLAVTETDLCGNLINFYRFDVLSEGSTGQRKASLEFALTCVADLALALKKPIVIEKLDFRKKKKDLYKMSARQARALSGLLYNKFTQGMRSKCLRQGIELLEVNPTYTSVIGRMKYAKAQGLTVHAAAAGVIGRRGQFSSNKQKERYLPASYTQQVADMTLHLQLPARKDGESLRHVEMWKVSSRNQEKILRTLRSAWQEFNRSCHGKGEHSPVKSFATSQPFETWKRKCTNHVAAIYFSGKQHDQVCVA